MSGLNFKGVNELYQSMTELAERLGLVLHVFNYLAGHEESESLSVYMAPAEAAATAPVVLSLTIEEAGLICETIDMLSGGNASNVFMWDGTDHADPIAQTFARLFRFVGMDVPEDMAR